MSCSSSLSLIDFTAYELPTKKWFNIVRPKMRLRVRAQDRDYVSSTVAVDHGVSDEMSLSSVQWAWSEDHAQFARPFFLLGFGGPGMLIRDTYRPSIADDQVFEVEIERRFLLGYKCIRRTKPVTLDQIRTGNQCALALYDGQHFTEMLEDRIEIGEITFTLADGETSSTTSSIPYSE